MPLLKEDTYCRMNRKTMYGKKGEEVTVLRTEGGVLIVQSVITKEKFPVLPAEITEGEEMLARLEAIPEPEQEPDPATAARRKKKSKPPPPQMNTLF